MTAVDSESMTALQDLLEERQRYEGWLRALEQRQPTTAPHVYHRVHTDYTLRLDRVLHRLSERTGQLNESAQALTTHLTALRTRESDRKDARQEAELRAVVGEYSEEEWAHLRDQADEELTQIAQERGTLEAELADLERIISMVRPQRQSTDQAPSAQPPSSPARQPTPPTEHPSIDNFVADWSVRREPHPTPEPPKLTVTDLSSVSEPKREQEKTLKCPECGAMNYATEWYCERCGGELATF